MNLICANILIAACIAGMQASTQAVPPPSVKPLVERGEKGDRMLAEKIKKAQLRSAPQYLLQPGPARKRKDFSDRGNKARL